jgi:hypothetical protein
MEADNTHPAHEIVKGSFIALRGDPYEITC